MLNKILVWARDTALYLGISYVLWAILTQCDAVVYKYCGDVALNGWDLITIFAWLLLTILYVDVTYLKKIE